MNRLTVHTHRHTIHKLFFFHSLLEKMSDLYIMNNFRDMAVFVLGVHLGKKLSKNPGEGCFKAKRSRVQRVSVAYYHFCKPEHQSNPN